MMRRQSFDGPWPGVVGGLVAVAATLLLRTVFGTRLFAELVVDASTYGLQPQGFSFFLEVFANLAKPLLFFTVLLVKVTMYLVAWRRVALRFAPKWGMPRAVVASAALVAVVLLIASVILVAASPASLGSGWPGYVLVTLVEVSIYAVVAATYAGAVGEHEALPRHFDSRRAFLARVPAIVLGGIALVVIGRRLVDTAGGGAQAPSHFGHETPEVTPTGDFYIVSKNLLDPSINADHWELRLGGLTNKMVTLSYDDIKAMPSVQQYTTLQCISNEIGGDLMSTSYWTGVPFKNVLDLAEPKSDATHVFFRSEDGFTSSLELARARADEVLLVYEMNGERLPDKHGYPVRLLLPGKYGMRNPKWITEIMLIDQDREGYWEQRGWSPQADMNTSCRIDLPSPGDDIAPGDTVRVAGVAFAGTRGISKVEVSADGGGIWAEATMKPPLSPYTWVLWYYDWSAPSTGAGQRMVMARATDGAGATQTSQEAPPYPSGSTGYPSVPVFFRAAKT
jgi:hypothetical protein